MTDIFKYLIVFDGQNKKKMLLNIPLKINIDH